MLHRIGRKVLTTGVVLATALWSLAAAALAVPAPVAAAGCTSGTLIKGPLPAVYYCGADGKRYVFTNAKAYFTWYSDFSGVQTVSATELADIAIGGNVTYRPGKKMVKIQSDPSVYVIGQGGVLRHVPSEQCAMTLYGADWNRQIDDIPDAFFVNYTVGTPLAACADYHRSEEEEGSPTINDDRHIGPPGLTPIAAAFVSPAAGATSVPLDARLEVHFTEPPLASSVNADTFTLTASDSASGTSIAGTVAVNGINATFTPSAALSSGKTYTATLTTGIVDHQDMHMTSPFSWSFTTGSAVAVAPTVTAVSPANGATGVAASADVTATFSLAMDASTLNGSTFTLTKSGSSSAAVAGAVSATGTTATFNPSADLEAGATYMAKITTGAKSSAGVALASDYSWSFTVAAAHVPTTIVSISPPDGATGVATSTAVTVTFSASMDAATLTTGTFTLSASGSPVAGTVSLSGNTATFTPSAALEAGTAYTAALSTSVRDADEQPLSEGAYSWTFTTAS
jgi:hypothetical protein